MADPVAVAVIVAIVATLAAEGIKVMIARSSCMVKCDPSTRESDDEEYVDEGASGFIGAFLTGRAYRYTLRRTVVKVQRTIPVECSFFLCRGIKRNNTEGLEPTTLVYVQRLLCCV